MIRTSNPPATSKAAYVMSSDFKTDHQTRILYAMKILAVPSSGKKIAEKAGLDYHAVMRRLCELERDLQIRKDGTGITDTGRPCALYRLIEQPSLMQVKELEPEPFTQSNTLTQLTIFE